MVIAYISLCVVLALPAAQPVSTLMIQFLGLKNKSSVFKIVGYLLYLLQAMVSLLPSPKCDRCHPLLRAKQPCYQRQKNRYWLTHSLCSRYT